MQGINTGTRTGFRAYYNSLCFIGDLAVFPLHFSFLWTCPQGGVTKSCLQKLKVDIFSLRARREKRPRVRGRETSLQYAIVFFSLERVEKLSE